MGLTDALPGAKAAPAPAEAPPPAAVKEEPSTNTYTLRGRCLSQPDGLNLAGVSVRLYQFTGRTSPPLEIATTVTDPEGRFEFTGLVSPRVDHPFDRLIYAVLAFADDRPIGIGYYRSPSAQEIEIRMALERATLSGKVIDTQGRPVGGAIVRQYSVDRRPIPGVLSATTDAHGQFTIDKVAIYKSPDGTPLRTTFTVTHPNHPETTGKVPQLPAEVVVTLPTGCLVTGIVADSATQQPVAGALVTIRRADEWGEFFATTDAAGRFRITLPEGKYNFLAETKDRLSIAVTDRECLAGENVELPPLKLIGGGFIAGQVFNTTTGEVVSVSERGEPITLGLFGLSQPVGRVISQIPLAEVDKSGRFVLRAAPGENFPYFVNTHGVRMAWDTRKQPPVVVKEGETTTYNMLITPPVPPAEKLQAARKLVESLSQQPTDRTAQILLEFRKLNHTVDEEELWCLLMRELVAIGRDAVPQLCDELDRTTENRMLRRLGFALRAIGDARAVPALIRAVPKTLLPSSSDYGLVVSDRELTEFMQSHDLDRGKRGRYFDLGRPVREIIGALHALTGQDFNDIELFSVSLSDDPRRQVLQRRIYEERAQLWAAWWEKNWQSLTDEAAYEQVNLPIADEPLAPGTRELGPAARLGDRMSGIVLSPATQGGQHAGHFLDLDAEFEPKWPMDIPRDDASHEIQRLKDWISQNGVDLCCIPQRAADGTETYVLRAFAMKVWEINQRDVRNLESLLAAGKLPEGRPVGELLMHFDAESQRYVPDANAAFLFVTREGNMGVIETTDRVTQTADLTRMASGPPTGVGFHKGVRFNFKSIIP